jgi:hypothetical protein
MWGVRRVEILRLLVLIFTIEIAAPLLAGEDNRCTGCEGFCGSSGLACGLCINEAVQTNCPDWGPGAYAECHSDSDWDVYCYGA